MSLWILSYQYIQHDIQLLFKYTLKYLHVIYNIRAYKHLYSISF